MREKRENVGKEAERVRERDNPKQSGVQYGAQTHQPWDHALSQSQKVEPGAPIIISISFKSFESLWRLFIFILSVNKKEVKKYPNSIVGKLNYKCEAPKDL